MVITGRRFTTYHVLQSSAVLALGLPPTTEWSWAGRGFQGELLARHADVSTPNNPIPGVTRVQEIWSAIPFEDIYQQFFAGTVAREPLRDLTITPGIVASNPVLFFHLNREEP